METPGVVQFGEMKFRVMTPADVTLFIKWSLQWVMTPEGEREAPVFIRMLRAAMPLLTADNLLLLADTIEQAKPASKAFQSLKHDLRVRADKPMHDV